MSESIKINGQMIGPAYEPYLIAELSSNHSGSLETALKIIEAAKVAGANAVKLQTYRADTITLKCDSQDFQITSGLWAGRTLFELYEEAHTPWEWHKPLFDHACKLGITLFSSPFDPTAIDLLEDLNAPAYKIASFEAIDLSLIRYAASTGKPMIISTGMANIEEIQEAIETARDSGCKELAILHCVSGYPAPAEDYNLKTIPDLIERFGLVTGLSDHTLGSTTAIASIALGSSIIEKHFTLNRNAGGMDDSFSLEPEELTALCRSARTAWKALGRVDYGRKSSEKENAQYRRSLYFVKALKPGDIVTSDSIRSIRPGFGLPPKYLAQCLGRRMSKSVKIGMPVQWDVFTDDIPHRKGTQLNV